jgi:hypothetical protein
MRKSTDLAEVAKAALPHAEPIEPQQIAILEIYLVLVPPAAGVKWHALPAIHSLLAGSL